MIKQSKWMALLLVTTMAAASLMGCGDKSAGDANGSAPGNETEPKQEASAEPKGENQDQLTLVWQSWDPISKYQPVIDAYEEKNPNIKIEYQQVSDYLTKIFTEAASDELPDLLACQVGYTQEFADAGVLEEIRVEDLKADADYEFDDFWDTTLDYAMYDGKYYGLPVDGGNYAWVYNKKIFDQLGIEVPDEGFSWDEFVEVSKQIMDRKDEVGVNYATLVNDYGLKTILPYIWQNGCEYLNADGTASLLDDQKAIDAVQYIKDLYEVHKVMPTMEKLDEGSLPIVGMLNSGSIAMGRVALWEALKLEDSEKLDWQLMHAPHGNDGAKGEVLYVNTLSVASTSKHKEEAMDFLKFVTSKEGLKVFLENTSDPQISVRKSLKEVSIAPFDASKNAGIFVDALEYCKWMPNILSVNDQITAVGRQLDRIWYDNEPVADVMKDTAKEVNGLLVK
ncbi:ABC transporter substrate-binding protein [Diplocloster agilis]|uniref:Sugar ABC transporter substrate-binding protein n=1 Tax=Diplocloster agilis TaxID=2850323 RepID=A0A949K3Q2_9FIRM|nr:sugar ABC transporter substrate-binding protein [Diplocloster agilis]MBU9739209.1 sugar ABC transporter substrate-binding protein [Diplocloster agilis]